VVHLENDGELVGPRSLDDPQLPGRAVEVERLREQLSNRLLPVTLTRTVGDPPVANVSLEIEAVVVDPQHSPLERRTREALAQAWGAIEPRRDVIAQPPQVEAAGRCEGTLLENQRRPDVHRGVIALGRQEQRVERGQRIGKSTHSRFLAIHTLQEASLHRTEFVRRKRTSRKGGAVA
jgi:hypothetical protein